MPTMPMPPCCTQMTCSGRARALIHMPAPDQHSMAIKGREGLSRPAESQNSWEPPQLEQSA